MPDKDSAQDVIESYRKRQQAARRAPLVIGLAALLVLVGAAILIFWLTGPNRPAIALFSTDTPTPTVTGTATATSTNTATPTATATDTPAPPTETPTPTEAGPIEYTVVEGDTLFDIAVRYKVNLDLIYAANPTINPASPIINVGDKIIIPEADADLLPTRTPVPENLARGTRINYVVQFGDSLAAIALEFNSTVDAIKEANKIENENEIYAGLTIIVPVNLVTPIPSATSSPTPGPGTPSATIAPPTATTAPATATNTRVP